MRGSPHISSIAMFLIVSVYFLLCYVSNRLIFFHIFLGNAPSTSEDLVIPSVGMTFENKEKLERFIHDYSDRNFSPINLRPVNYGKYILLYCPHSRRRKSTARLEHRPNQNRMYNENNPCQVRGNVRRNECDQSYVITSIFLEHNHAQSSSIYGTYRTVRSRKEKIDNQQWLMFKKVKAKPSNIAQTLSEELDITLSRQDVYNRLAKVTTSHETNVRDLKTDIEAKGGIVNYTLDPSSQNVNTLWIQTKKMRDELFECSPHLFETDLTHQTNSNNYKLWTAAYLNTKFDRWDVAGILLLAMESKENVHQGLGHFQQSLPLLKESPIFIVDKDFNFIDVLQTLFPASKILLCAEHTKRYFKDQVIVTSKSFWSDHNCYLTKEEKDQIFADIEIVRKSQTEQQYLENEQMLLNKTSTLVVRPGNVKKNQWFKDYYLKNWKSCSEKWVWAYRKKLLTLGANDTNGCEGAFGVIKAAINSEFKGVLPSINALIGFLPKFFDRRIERNNVRDLKYTVHIMYKD